MIGLATLLSFWKVYEMPQGGSVTAGSMIPIIVIALRHGPGLGLLAGGAYGVVQYLAGPYFVHPLQLLLDYPVAFGCLGLAGYFRRSPALGAGVGVAGRFLAHLVSGAVFFASYAPAGQSPWAYSAIYNGSYLGVEVLVTAIVVWALARSGAMRAALPLENRTARR
jgi:thiamine transporter